MTDIKKKIEIGIKLQNLHDKLCPDYEPDWDNENTAKYYVYLNKITNKYAFDYEYSFTYSASVWFPNMRTANTVCNILNGKIKDL